MLENIDENITYMRQPVGEQTKEQSMVYKCLIWQPSPKIYNQVRNHCEQDKRSNKKNNNVKFRILEYGEQTLSSGFSTALS